MTFRVPREKLQAAQGSLTLYGSYASQLRLDLQFLSRESAPHNKTYIIGLSSHSLEFFTRIIQYSELHTCATEDKCQGMSYVTQSKGLDGHHNLASNISYFMCASGQS